MRITFTSMPDTLMTQLGSLTSKQAQLETQVMTGKQFTQLEDDPAAMQQVLNLQGQNSQISQYRQNISALQQTSLVSSNAMSSLETYAQRAGDIATSVDSLTSKDTLQADATEVDQILQKAVALMNTTDSDGNYMFGGTQTAQPPFATTTTNNQITAVTYQGDNSVSSAEIASGLTVSAQVLGANNAGAGPAGLITDSRSGADFFNHLISLRDHLQAGDTASITKTDSHALTTDLDNITSQVSAAGLVQSQLTDADTVAASRAQAVEQMVSSDSDVDLTQTLTQLSATQTAYQAALQSGASLLKSNLSLMNYIS
jgi:flagellar hook-associated protein 3 FlgL